MSIGLVTGLLFGCILLFLLTGLPVSFVLGGVAMVFTYFLWGPQGLATVANRAWGGMTNFIIVCVPLFIYMGVMLERSGIASSLYTMMHRWSGALRGGLAAGTVLICMIFAAMTGLSGASTVALGLVALPEMLKRGYNKDIAIGSIGGGGALGILIPPSATMVIYAMIAQESVGQLFMGGVFPGIILGFLFIAYILIRSSIQKNIAPALPMEERAGWGAKLTSLRAVILPMLLIVAVLGSIFAGIATPTEAAAVGAFGATLCAAVYGKLNWRMLNEAALNYQAGLVKLSFAGNERYAPIIGDVGVNFLEQTVDLELDDFGVFIEELPPLLQDLTTFREIVTAALNAGQLDFITATKLLIEKDITVGIQRFEAADKQRQIDAQRAQQAAEQAAGQAEQAKFQQEHGSKESIENTKGDNAIEKQELVNKGEIDQIVTKGKVDTGMKNVDVTMELAKLKKNDRARQDTVIK